MENCILIAINLLLLFTSLKRVLKNITVIKMLSMAIGFFLIEYLIVSSVFLFCNYFKVSLILTVIVSVNTFAYMFFRIRKKKNQETDYSIYSERILILILIAMVFVSVKKGDFLETGADSGVYYQKMLQLINSESTLQSELYEYYKYPEIREEIIEYQNGQKGLYFRALQDDHYLFEYHGLPTWPAFMALIAELIGVQYARQALTILFLMTIVSIYYIGENLQPGKINKYFCFFLMGILPLAVYSSKTTLAELYYVTILVIGCWFLTEKNRKIKLCGGVAIGLLGYIHIQTFMYWPILAIMLLLLSILRKNIIYGWANILQSLLFGISFFYCLKVSHHYSSEQINNNFSRWLSCEGVVIAFECAIIILLIVQALVMSLTINKNQFLEVITETYFKYYKKVIAIVLFVLILLTIYNGYCLGFTDKFVNGRGNWESRSQYAARGWQSLIHLNIFSILAATSYVTIPIGIYHIWKTKIKDQDISSILLLGVLYSMAIYTILRIDTSSNYYASRYYFVFLVPVTIIFILSVVNSTRNFCIISLVALCTALPYTGFMINHTAFEQSEKSVYDIVDIIPENAQVFTKFEVSMFDRQLVNILRVLKQTDVLPFETLEKLDKDHIEDEYYIVSDQEVYSVNYEKIFDKAYNISDDLVTFSELYPRTIGYNTRKLYVYKRKSLNVKFCEETLNDVDGFYSLEKTGDGTLFAWSSANTSIVFDGYPYCENKITVRCLNIMPDQITQKIYQDLLIYCNNQQVLYDISENGKFIDISFIVDRNVVEKQNKLHLISDTWCPKSVLGTEDTRHLGIPITEIFVEENDK